MLKSALGAGALFGFGLAFSTTAWVWPRASLWQLLPACAHGALVAAWPIDRIDPVIRALFRAAGGWLAHAPVLPLSCPTYPKVT